MARLLCDQVSAGLRPSERTIAVKDIHGRTQFLRVELAFLTHEDGKYWLPVGKVYEDKQREIALVELPQEAESGTNRLWVRFINVLEYAARTPA